VAAGKGKIPPRKCAIAGNDRRTEPPKLRPSLLGRLRWSAATAATSSGGQGTDLALKRYDIACHVISRRNESSFSVRRRHAEKCKSLVGLRGGMRLHLLGQFLRAELSNTLPSQRNGCSSPPTSVFKGLAGKLCGPNYRSPPWVTRGVTTHIFSEGKKSVSSATRGQRGHHALLRTSSFVRSV
jgi:hypothetical protein